MDARSDLTEHIAASGVFRRFVSSTFEDMRTERDLLARRVFPAVRRQCEQRGVSFVDVDLRWGITEEEAAEGRVLPLCFAEIERSRPGLIIMLGDRYGSVVDEIPPDLARQEPWLLSSDLRGASITELEIHHGLLRCHGAAQISLCYVRHQSGASSRHAVPNARLQRLKTAIADAGCPVREYETTEQFATLIEGDLQRCVDQFVPHQNDATVDEQEERAQQALRRTRARAFVSVPDGFRKLERQVDGTSPPLVITGPAGCGKTTWLAAWLAGRETESQSRTESQTRRTRPFDSLRRLVTGGSGVRAVRTWSHFVGATAASADWAQLTDRFVREVAHWTGTTISPGDSPAARRTAFNRALGAASTMGKTLLVIDGLDRLQPSVECRLGWLPPELPANIRLVVTTSSSEDRRILESRGCTIHDVAPWSAPDRTRFIETFLSYYGKRLAPASQQRIAEHPASGSLFFLRTLLDELRLTSSFGTLDRDVGRYLSCDSDEGLCHEVLERVEHDDRSATGLVRRLLVLLTSAHEGLSEPELLDAAGAGDVRASPLVWARLRTSLGDAIVERPGTVGVESSVWREAIQARWLRNPDSRRVTAARLASILERAPLHRQVRELPWQYLAAGNQQALTARVGDPDFIEAAWQWAPDNLERWWSAAHAGQDQTQALAATIARFAGRPAYRIAGLLSRRSHAIDMAITVARTEAASARQASDTARLIMALGDLALAHRADGASNEALTTLREQESVCRRDGNQSALRICLGNQAVLLKELQATEEALRLLDQLVSASRAASDEPALASALLNRAELQITTQPDVALRSLIESEGLFRALGDRDGLAAAVGNLAAVEYATDPRRAQQRQEEEFAILSGLGHDAEMALACARQASVAMHSSDMDRALELCQRARTLAGRVRPDVAYRCLLVESSVMFNLGVTGRARALLSEALALGALHPELATAETRAEASALAERLRLSH